MSARLRFGIVVSALEVQFWFPVWLLFLLDKGFTPEQASLADGVFRLVATACEVPAGWASDRIGRKKSLYLALGGTTATFLCIAGVRDQATLLLAWSMWGVLWALVSGLLTAYGWELGCQLEGDGTTQAVGFIRVRRVAAAGALLVSLVSAGALYEANPVLPFFITAVIAAVAIPVAARLPDISGDVSGGSTSVERRIRGIPRRMWPSLFAGATVLVAGWSIQMVFQPLGLEAGLGPRGISLLFAGFALAQLTGAWAVGRVRASRTAVLVGSVLGITTTCFGVWAGFRTNHAVAISVLCLIALGFFYSVGTAYCDIWVAELSANQNRATMLSISSLLGGLGMVLTRPALGIVSGRYSASMAFGIWAIVCAVLVLVLWLVLGKREPSTSSPQKTEAK